LGAGCRHQPAGASRRPERIASGVARTKRREAIVSESLRVLCVDDEEDVRFIVSLSLNLDGDADVRLAANAEEALAALADPDWQPDCIILDAIMPGTDGKALYAAIRDLPAHGDTPIVFLTGAVYPREIDLYRGLGAVGVISKPFDPLALEADVRRFVAEAA
jgi:two-component system, OmpR family, response regulator